MNGLYIYILVCITLFFCWATALCVSSDSTKWYSRSMDSCRRTLALQDVNLFPVRRKKPFDMSECQKKCQTEWIYIIIYIPRSSFVALFSGRLYRLLTSFEISVRKSSSWPKRLLLQFTYDFPGFISCCITMLHIQPHPILFQLNSLMWAIDKTKWCNDKWPANRQCQPPPTLYPPQANKIETLNSDQPC